MTLEDPGLRCLPTNRAFVLGWRHTRGRRPHCSLGCSHDRVGTRQGLWSALQESAVQWAFHKVVSNYRAQGIFQEVKTSVAGYGG